MTNNVKINREKLTIMLASCLMAMLIGCLLGLSFNSFTRGLAKINHDRQEQQELDEEIYIQGFLDGQMKGEEYYD